MKHNVKIYKWVATHFLKLDEKEKQDAVAEQTRIAQGLQFNVSLFKLMTADADLADITGIYLNLFIYHNKYIIQKKKNNTRIIAI